MGRDSRGGILKKRWRIGRLEWWRVMAGWREDRRRDFARTVFPNGEGNNKEFRRNMGGREEVSEDEDWVTNRRRHIECPTFSGDDLDGWVFRMEQYFAIQRYRERETDYSRNSVGQ